MRATTTRPKSFKAFGVLIILKFQHWQIDILVSNVTKTIDVWLAEHEHPGTRLDTPVAAEFIDQTTPEIDRNVVLCEHQKFSLGCVNQLKQLGWRRDVGCKRWQSGIVTDEVYLLVNTSGLFVYFVQGCCKC